MIERYQIMPGGAVGTVGLSEYGMRMYECAGIGCA